MYDWFLFIHSFFHPSTSVRLKMARVRAGHFESERSDVWCSSACSLLSGSHSVPDALKDYGDDQSNRDDPPCVSYEEHHAKHEEREQNHQDDAHDPPPGFFKDTFELAVRHGRIRVGLRSGLLSPSLILKGRGWGSRTHDLDLRSRASEIVVLPALVGV